MEYLNLNYLEKSDLDGLMNIYIIIQKNINIMKQYIIFKK